MSGPSSVFDGIAAEYDLARPSYSPELAELVLTRTGTVSSLLEVGAGTGKATEQFAPYGLPITCVERSPVMARVLAAKFAGQPHVEVAVCAFEDWTPPPGGVSIVYSGQAWHWMPVGERCWLAHKALAPGGTLAVFEHEYTVVDARLDDQLRAAYAATAPHLVPQLPDQLDSPEDHWLFREVDRSGMFTDVEARIFSPVVRWSAAEYLSLLGTFAPNLLLPADQRSALFGRIGDAIGRVGGHLDIRLDTVLAMGRRRTP
ncbi:class I SAM-dependent methyltransferase [Longispora albida]|uniref:class I SAM-dependent methyltransferase n=1 Tax=Longispora albida TaxID=203523 RepID=UPI00035C4BDF|nr:class I SAM-dependent methyltransferase [Longispora albida]